MFSYHVLHDERHLGNFLSSFIYKNKIVLIIRRVNATNRAPPTHPWDQIFSNRRDAAPFLPHQGHVAENMVEREGRGGGDFSAIFLGVEEGESRD